jgi:MraZ protein
MLNGGFNGALDEKGRFTFPSRLREAFAAESLVVTRGVDQCLWAYAPLEWRLFAEKLENAPSMKQDVRLLQRHFLGWASALEFDKLGRVVLPQALREWAALKRDCVIMGLGSRVEIWDADVYAAYSGGLGDPGKLLAAAESLSELF